MVTRVIQETVFVIIPGRAPIEWLSIIEIIILINETAVRDSETIMPFL